MLSMMYNTFLMAMKEGKLCIVDFTEKQVAHVIEVDIDGKARVTTRLRFAPKDPTYIMEEPGILIPKEVFTCKLQQRQSE